MNQCFLRFLFRSSLFLPDYLSLFTPIKYQSPSPTINFPAHSSARRNIKLTLIVSFVEIFHTQLLGENLSIFSLNMKNFLRFAVRSETAASQKINDVLKYEAKGLKTENFGSVFGAADAPLLREEGTEQLRQVLRFSTAVQICWVNELRNVE